MRADLLLMQVAEALADSASVTVSDDGNRVKRIAVSCNFALKDCVVSC